MIANAGIGKLLSLVDMTVDVWDHIMTVNVRSVMLAYKYAARQMIKQGRGGRIVGALLFHFSFGWLFTCGGCRTVGAASMTGKRGEPL